MTTKTKHSPGPWLADANGDDRDLFRYVLDANGVPVCRLELESDVDQELGITRDQREADALLISASAHLLSALERIARIDPERPHAASEMRHIASFAANLVNG